MVSFGCDGLVEHDLLFSIAWLLLWVMFIIVRVIPSRNVPTVRRSRKERFRALKQEGLCVFFMIFLATYGNVIVGALYLLNPPWASWSYLSLSSELRIAGLILSIASLPYAYWVGQTLANYYSFTVEIQKGHKLITTGPYKRVRHPLYAATLLFLIGQILVSDNWVFLAILLAMVPGFYVRIKREEQMMIEEFGDEYRDYIKQTGRLLPRLGSRKADSQ